MSDEVKRKISEKKKGIYYGGRKVLTENQVRDIRFKHLVENVLTQKEIANIYNVGTTTISNIALNKTWKNVTA